MSKKETAVFWVVFESKNKKIERRELVEGDVSPNAFYSWLENYHDELLQDFKALVMVNGGIIK